MSEAVETVVNPSSHTIIESKIEIEHRGKAMERRKGFEENSLPFERSFLQWNSDMATISNPFNSEGKFDNNFMKILENLEEELDSYIQQPTKGTLSPTRQHYDVPHIINLEDNNHFLTTNDIVARTKIDQKKQRAGTIIEFTEKPWSGDKPADEVTEKSRRMYLQVNKDAETGKMSVRLAAAEYFHDQDGHLQENGIDITYGRKNGKWIELSTSGDAEEKFRESEAELDSHREGEIDLDQWEKNLREQERIIELNPDKKEALFNSTKLDIFSLREMASEKLGIQTDKDFKEKYYDNYELFADEDTLQLADELVVMGRDKNDPAGWFLRGKDGDTKFMRRAFIKEGEMSEGELQELNSYNDEEIPCLEDIFAEIEAEENK